MCGYWVRDSRSQAPVKHLGRVREGNAVQTEERNYKGEANKSDPPAAGGPGKGAVQNKPGLVTVFTPFNNDSDDQNGTLLSVA